MNTVENRRIALLLVVAAIAFHLLASGTLFPLETVKNPDMHASLQGLYAEYDLFWHRK